VFSGQAVGTAQLDTAEISHPTRVLHVSGFAQLGESPGTCIEARRSMRNKQVGNALLLGLVVVLGCNHLQSRSPGTDAPPADSPAPPLAAGAQRPAPSRIAAVPTQASGPQGLVVATTRRPAGAPAAQSLIRITSATAAPETKTVDTAAEGPAEPILPPPTGPDLTPPPAAQVAAAAGGQPASETPEEVAVVGVSCRRRPSGRLLCPPGTTLAQAQAAETGPDLTPPQPAQVPARRPATVPVPPVVRTDGVGEVASELTRASYLTPAAEASGLEVKPAQAMDVLPPEHDATPAAPLKQGFGFAKDYGWLMGELQYVRSRGVWRLRYAEADQDDRYGGTVTLVGEGLTADCKSGQIVRVEGQMINPESTDPRPPYWARKLRILRAPLDTDE
jgi:hypothetical protein